MGAERFDAWGKAAEADAVEQEQPVADDGHRNQPEGSPAGVGSGELLERDIGGVDADPADVADQERGVPLDEEEYPEEYRQ